MLYTLYDFVFKWIIGPEILLIDTINESIFIPNARIAVVDDYFAGDEFVMVGAQNYRSITTISF